MLSVVAYNILTCHTRDSNSLACLMFAISQLNRGYSYTVTNCLLQSNSLQNARQLLQDSTNSPQTSISWIVLFEHDETILITQTKVQSAVNQFNYMMIITTLIYYLICKLLSAEKKKKSLIIHRPQVKRVDTGIVKFRLSEQSKTQTVHSLQLISFIT